MEGVSPGLTVGLGVARGVGSLVDLNPLGGRCSGTEVGGLLLGRRTLVLGRLLSDGLHEVFVAVWHCGS
jgi:hypothetical protein